MKHLFKKAVIWIIRKEARLVLWRFRPIIIGVTGSVGKTSTKEAIRVILEAHPARPATAGRSGGHRVQASPKSYNSEIGLPLTILGESTAWDDAFDWLYVIGGGLKRMLSRSSYPERLIVEFGVDRPQDMDHALALAQPTIGVITAIGEIPVHVEFFAGPKELADEKEKLVRSLPSDGHALLNYDDETVREMGARSLAPVITYGFDERADVRASQEQLLIRNEKSGHIPEGIMFRLDYKGSSVPVRLFGAFGKPPIYAALAGAAVGIVSGMNLIEIAEALTRYIPPPGRMRLLDGIKNTRILDDSYNASPLAMHAAFDILRDLPGRRKIAVVGDMLEIGKYTPEAHRAIVRRFSEWGDLLVTVGPRARFAAEEARERGMPAERVWSFYTADEVEKELQPFLEEGDLILIKGSQAIRLERVVEAIMAHPERASELLCRQEKFWKRK